jgi:hypothetical protein
MAEVVKVSTVESNQKLMSAVEDYFKKRRYAEITQAIGMHSILIDPQHTREDQKQLYRSVLDMIKNRISGNLGNKYSAWYAAFPEIMDQIVAERQIVTDNSSTDMLSSHRAAFGPFKSVNDFFFWGLHDRRLSLDQIIRYIEKTTELRNR